MFAGLPPHPGLRAGAAHGPTSSPQVSYSDRLKRVAILVSKLDHCLYDLLIRREAGELPCDIPVVISNHPGASGWAGGPAAGWTGARRMAGVGV